MKDDPLTRNSETKFERTRIRNLELSAQSHSPGSGQPRREKVIELDERVVEYKVAHRVPDRISITVVVIKITFPTRFIRMRCEVVLQSGKVLVRYDDIQAPAW